MPVDPETGEQVGAELGQFGRPPVAWTITGDGDDLADGGAIGARLRRQEEDPVGELDGFVDVVRHQEDGRRGGRVDVEQQVLHPEAGQGIERPERLIEQEHPGVPGERPGQGRPLGHPTGDLAWSMAAKAVSPTSARSSSTRVRALCPETPAGRPSSTFRARVRHGRSRGSWNATAQRGSMPTTGSPPILTLPLVGESSPAAIRRSVDLPQPLAPRMTTTSPGSTVTETSRRTT